MTLACSCIVVLHPIPIGVLNAYRDIHVRTEQVRTTRVMLKNNKYLVIVLLQLYIVLILFLTFSFKAFSKHPPKECLDINSVHNFVNIHFYLPSLSSVNIYTEVSHLGHMWLLSNLKALSTIFRFLRVILLLVILNIFTILTPFPVVLYTPGSFDVDYIPWWYKKIQCYGCL